MSFASMGSGPRRKKGPRPPGAPATGSLSANDVALAEEEEAKKAGTAPLVSGDAQQALSAQSRRDQTHEKFLQQYTRDAAEVETIFAELGAVVEQQQESLDTIDDNTTKAVDELSTGIEDYAGAVREKAKGTSNKRAMAAAAVGVVGGIATGGVGLGVAAVGGLAGAVIGKAAGHAEFTLVADAAQGEVDAIKVQKALGPLKDRSEWSPDGRECEGCSAAFSIIVRRHHCRACGGVFCSTCAPKAAVRLCTSCSQRMQDKTAVHKLQTSADARSGDGSDLMAEWGESPSLSKQTAPKAPAAAPSSGGQTRVGTPGGSERDALLRGGAKPPPGRRPLDGDAGSAESEALRAKALRKQALQAAERAAGAGAATASKVSDQGEQLDGVASNAGLAEEIAARAERVDDCFTTVGAIKTMWSRTPSLTPRWSSAEPEPEPESEPEPEPEPELATETGDETLDQLAKLTSQMGRTASDLSTAMSQQREQLEGIDDSVTATSKSTSRLDASQKKRLAKLEGRGARSSSSSSGATAAVGWAASKTRSI